MNFKFAQRLSFALEKKGMTQTELAKKTGLSNGMISQYLSGLSKPKEENLKKIAEAVNVPAAWLLGYEVQVGNDKLMSIYNELTLDGKNKVLEYAEMVLMKEKNNV